MSIEEAKDKLRELENILCMLTNCTGCKHQLHARDVEGYCGIGIKQLFVNGWAYAECCKKEKV